ncbi:hypothetical protein KAU45_09695, partial [bacterium]|nr:hypothetical protein [bacterium]
MRRLIPLLLVALSAALGFQIEADRVVSRFVPQVPGLDFDRLLSGEGAGYYYWDSNETGEWAPEYNWIDASGGTDLGTGDDASFTVTTPFLIRFCNRNYPSGSTAYVGCNGALSFKNAGIPAANQNIPVSAAPNALIAVVWDDLRGTTGDHLYSYLDISNELSIWVISYDPWHRYLSIGPFRFQIHIYERPMTGMNNTIELHYQTVWSGGYNLGQSATVGLENWDGTQAAAYSYNDDLEAGFAIRFIDTNYVDNWIGEFDLLSPRDGSDDYHEGDTVTFTWEAAEYSGDGSLTYTWLLDTDPVLTDAQEFDAGGDTQIDHTFVVGDQGVWYWSVRAQEDGFGHTRMAESIRSIEILPEVAVVETTWGQIKA